MTNLYLSLIGFALFVLPPIGVAEWARRTAGSRDAAIGLTMATIERYGLQLIAVCGSGVLLIICAGLRAALAPIVP